MANFRKLLLSHRVGWRGLKSTLVLLFMLWLWPAAAHEIRPAVADVTVGADTVRIELVATARVWQEALPAG